MASGDVQVNSPTLQSFCKYYGEVGLKAREMSYLLF